MGDRITSNQRELYLKMVESATARAILEAEPSHDWLERLTENRDEFIQQVIAVIREFSQANRYADEEIGSTIAYPLGYNIQKISRQIDALRQIFPTLGSADEAVADRPLPEGAEGYFAIPRWEKIADSPAESVATIVSKLSSTRPVMNLREGYLKPLYMRPHIRTANMLLKLCQEQEEHDILIVPAQFGLRHRGRSARRGRQIYTREEFGLGAFAVGCMLITHPDRMRHWEHLQVECSGDECGELDYEARYSVPVYEFGERMVEFRTRSRADFNVHYGSATGFLTL